MTDLRARLGLALKRERKRRKLTQPQLAELTNLSVRHVADVEGGKKNYRLETFSSLAAALDWDPLVNVTVADTPDRAAARAVTAKMRSIEQRLEKTLEGLKAVHAQFVNRGASTHAPGPGEMSPSEMGPGQMGPGQMKSERGETTSERRARRGRLAKPATRNPKRPLVRSK
jgi:transcriptional regulator with XRE-family HTH domain